MLDSHFKKEEFTKAVKENVKMLYRKTIDEATQQQIFQAVSLAVKDVIIDNWLATQKQYEKDDPKIVYYHVHGVSDGPCPGQQSDQSNCI